jgi:tripartite-type tricarboxylate transporter receptor subunit TctC
MRFLKNILFFHLLSLYLLTLPTLAAEYPNKTVTILAPVSPGGGLDLIARTVAERLTKSLGQSFIVDNQSGGGGSIASQKAARAAPDGYTLMLAYVGTHGTNPAVRKLPYDAIKDFSPIAMVGGTPNVLSIYSSLPIKNLKEFIQYAKDNPSKMNYGSAGLGTLTHLSMEQLKQQAGFESTHVPYRGIAPAFTDILGGQTISMMPGLAAALPHIKSGKVRPIAVTGPKRHALIPDVPTFKELGFDGFEGVQWYGVAGPANLPPTIITLLNNEINNAIQSPELKERLSSEAIQPMPMSPEQFGQYIKDDIARWSKIAKARNIQLD